MSNIEALDKLRTVIDLDYKNCYTRYEFYDALEKCADEIEHEVSDRFVELPVDADGVPIRAGDLIEFGRKGERLEVTHIGWTKHGDPTIAYRRSNGTLDCSCIGIECRHVKPRTLEDVLAASAAELHSDRIDSLDRRIERCAAKYADEIRELMGVGE